MGRGRWKTQVLTNYWPRHNLTSVNSMTLRKLITQCSLSLFTYKGSLEIIYMELEQWKQVLWIITPHDQVLWIITPHNQVLWMITPHDQVLWTITPHDQVLRMITPHDQVLWMITPHNQVLWIITPHNQVLRMITPHNQVLWIITPHDHSQGCPRKSVHVVLTKMLRVL